MKPFTVSGLLRAAASYIEIHGHEQREWANGGMHRDGGPCCPIVALSRIAYRHSADIYWQAGDALVSRVGHAPGWSDRTPTAEVLATMRKVARELDEKTA